MADQHRFDTRGKDVGTPNLDALAADGADFMAHFSSTPSCTCARAGILTGLSPWKHGMLGYGEVAPKYPFEMPAAMAAAGYRTMVIGKDHFGWNQTSDKPFPHGYEQLQIYDGIGNGLVNGTEYDDYDRWFQKQKPGEDPLKSGGLDWNSWRGAPYEYEERLHPTAWTGRRAVKAIKELSKEAQPFFLKVSFHRPHSPYDPPRRLLDKARIPAKSPARAQDSWDIEFKDCPAKGTKDAWCGKVHEKDRDLARRAYRASTAFVDEKIGEVLGALADAGVMDNTFILYTTDHGDMQNDHYLWRKGYPYQGSAHIPLIVRWPHSMESRVSIQRGTKVHAPTELRDVFPTFLDVVGHWNAAAATALDGKPLLQLLQDTHVSWRQWVDLEHDVHFSPLIHWNALTDGRLKYVFHAHSGTEQFFNLTADPMETKDLSREPLMGVEIKKWRERMVQQFVREGRGEAWVQNGKLVVRTHSCLYSPHFPLPTRNCRIVTASTQQMLAPMTAPAPVPLLTV